MSTRKKGRPTSRTASRKKQALKATGVAGKLSVAELQQLVATLKTRQIELEMQNNQLREDQAVLEESRERYSTLYDFAPIGYLTLNRNGRILESNLMAAQILGLDREALLNTQLPAYTKADFRDHLYFHLQAAFSKSGKHVCEAGMTKADGSALTVRLESTVFVSEPDRLCLMALIDISDQRSHREIEERFRQIAVHAPVMVWIADAANFRTWVNKQWVDFTGRSLDKQLGHGWSEGVHPDDLERCVKTFVSSSEAQQPFQMEYRVRRHDGEWRWVTDAGNPMYSEDGVFVGYIGSCIDVTERRQTEDALREREERLRAILNTASDSIITINRNGIIIGANPATEHIFGYALDKLLGQNIKILMPSPYREENDSYIARYLESGEAHIVGMQRETVAVRKDGSLFPVELAVNEIGHLGLFVGIHRDISARKQTELALEQYRKNLQKAAAELMIAEERQRQQLAQDLHDSLGHNLFRARMKLDQLAAAGTAVGEISAILEEIAKTVNTLTFELSPPVLRLLGLRPSIHWLARDMKQRYGLTIDIDEDEETYPVDERIAMVLFRSLRELMINIAKHAHTDEAIVTVRTLDRSLQIDIEDQGKGFDPDDRFRQVEAGRFGLFSIRERLEYINGTFNIDSAPGKGTRITLTAPLAKAAEAQSS